LINRRNFLEITGGAGLLAMFSARALRAAETLPRIVLPKTRSTVAGVSVGCTSLSFMLKPIEQVPAILKHLGFGITEITSDHLEPVLGKGRFPWASGAGFKGLARGWTPEAREKLRQWRLTTPLSYFEGIGRKFQEAGIDVYSYNAHFADDVSDAELDRSCQVTRAMGAQVVTVVCSQTNEFAKRLDAAAKKNRFRMAIHNTPHPNVLTSWSAYDRLLEGCSEYLGINLDVGHYADGGGDLVDLLSRKSDRIFDIHLRPKGHEQASPIPPPGDTTVRDTLIALRDNHLTIPANLEYEVFTPDNLIPVERWFAYCKKVLASAR
jgi:sugar phosphate isomerase/epimerase